MYVSNNPALLPSIFKTFGIPFGRNKETGAFFVPNRSVPTVDDCVAVIASCDRAIAECAPTATLLIDGLRAMANDASRKAAAMERKDKAWQFAGPGSGEKAGGGPPPARRAKLAEKSEKDRALRNAMRSNKGK